MQEGGEQIPKARPSHKAQIAHLTQFKNVHQRIEGLKNENIEVKEKNVELIEQNKDIKENSLKDSLTGLNNRLFFYGDPKTGEVGMFERLIREAYRGKNPLSIVMFDIDHFKQTNDENGHHVGDLVLQGLSWVIKNNLRGTDYAVRLGGEEILLLLPITDRAGAAHEAEKIRIAIDSTVFAEEVVPLKVTVSAGVSSYVPQGGKERLAYEIEGAKLLNAADKAMYKAKNAGRNQTWVATNNEIEQLNFKPADQFTTGPLIDVSKV